MRVLILNHVANDSVYGANQSLQRHVNALREHSDIELRVINRIPIGRLGSPKPDNSAYFPMSHNYEGATRLKRLISSAYNSLTSHKDLLKQIEAIQPDVIHINSLTLLPTVPLLKRNKKLRSIPIVASVREVFKKDTHESELAIISAIDVLAAIDPITYDRLFDVLPLESKTRLRVCPNLFELELIKGSHSAPATGATFALIGRVEPEKGARFVVEAFREAAAPRARLMIVGGSARDQYFARKRSAPQGDGIVFTGQIAHLVNSPLYASVDFIIRGERRFHGLGRSGIEGLLSGKVLLLPSPSGINPTTDQTLRELTEVGRIHWYRADDTSSLSKTISSLAASKPPGGTHALPVDSSLWFQDSKNYAEIWARNYRDALRPEGRND